MTALSPRLLSALGVAPADLLERPDRAVLAQVDDVDQRFRDAIKAGARPVHPPIQDPHLGRCAEVIDTGADRGTRVIVLSARAHDASCTLEPSA